MKHINRSSYNKKISGDKNDGGNLNQITIELLDTIDYKFNQKVAPSNLRN